MKDKLDIETKKKVAEFEKKKSKKYNNMSLEELLELFRECNVLKAYNLKNKKEFTFYNLNYQKNIKIIRRRCSRPGHYGDLNEAAIFTFYITLVLDELGLDFTEVLYKDSYGYLSKLE